MTESTQSGLYKALESSQLRQAKLGVTTIVALLSTAAGMGITWGAYSNRLKEVEDKVADANRTMLAGQIAQASTAAQYADIIRRLDRIEQQRK